MQNFEFIAKQKSYFLSGKTRSISKRIEMLEKLNSSIVKNELKIFESLKKDHKFRLLLDQTHDYRRYKRRQYFFAKRRIKILINLIDKELAE